MTTEWDIGIREFLTEFGNANPSQAVTDEQIEAYRGKFPDTLLRFWKEQGWGGYADGLFWTVNPADYHDVLQQWLVDTPHENEPDNYVIARSAFGNLYIWNSKKGYAFKITLPNHWLRKGPHDVEVGRNELEDKADSFFCVMNKKRLDQTDEYNKPLFQKALKRLGPLKPNEMYGYVPAICLGGKELLTNLQKVDIFVHLSILAELQPTEMFDYNNYR